MSFFTYWKKQLFNIWSFTITLFSFVFVVNMNRNPAQAQPVKTRQEEIYTFVLSKYFWDVFSSIHFNVGKKYIYIFICTDKITPIHWQFFALTNIHQENIVLHFCIQHRMCTIHKCIGGFFACMLKCPVYSCVSTLKRKGRSCFLLKKLSPKLRFIFSNVQVTILDINRG